MKKFSKFFGLGIITTLIEYVFFTLVARLMSNDFLWLATLIGGIAGVIASFILNTKFVWTDKKSGKQEIIEVFGYGMIKTFLLKEGFTFLFKLLTPVYQFAYTISSAIKLPFDYAFIESTGVFCFTALATMMITYFVYNKLIFTKKKDEETCEKVDMQGIGKSGKEK